MNLLLLYLLPVFTLVCNTNAETVTTPIPLGGVGNVVNNVESKGTSIATGVVGENQINGVFSTIVAVVDELTANAQSVPVVGSLATILGNLIKSYLFIFEDIVNDLVTAATSGNPMKLVAALLDLVKMIVMGVVVSITDMPRVVCQIDTLPDAAYSALNSVCTPLTSVLDQIANTLLDQISELDFESLLAGGGFGGLGGLSSLGNLGGLDGLGK